MSRSRSGWSWDHRATSPASGAPGASRTRRRSVTSSATRPAAASSSNASGSTTPWWTPPGQWQSRASTGRRRELSSRCRVRRRRTSCGAGSARGQYRTCHAVSTVGPRSRSPTSSSRSGGPRGTPRRCSGCSRSSTGPWSGQRSTASRRSRRRSSRCRRQPTRPPRSTWCGVEVTRVRPRRRAAWASPGKPR